MNGILRFHSLARPGDELAPEFQKLLSRAAITAAREATLNRLRECGDTFSQEQNAPDPACKARVNDIGIALDSVRHNKPARVGTES